MSERESYPAGVPCWVESLQPGARAALGFYGSLFGWDFVESGSMPADRHGQYFVAQIRGRDVAGIGTLNQHQESSFAMWTTHIRVDSVDEALAKATAAGGSRRDGPYDVLPAGRVAELADPAGALFRIWEAKSREGAQLVNEPQAWALSALRTTDTEGSIAFYGAVFGWQPETFGGADSGVTLWRLPGYVGGEPEQPVPRDVIGIMTPTGGKSTAGARHAHWSVEFWVDNTDATAELATSLGGEVLVAPYDTPGSRNAVLADPHGAVFSISNLVTDASITP